MSSFNNSLVSESFMDSDHIGGKGGGDICNIFDFDEDNAAVGQMQSEWDADTSMTMKKRKFKAFLTNSEPSNTLLRQAQGNCLLSQERLQLHFDPA
jgi:hypothetical protein